MKRMKIKSVVETEEDFEKAREITHRTILFIEQETNADDKMGEQVILFLHASLQHHLEASKKSTYSWNDIWFHIGVICLVTSIAYTLSKIYLFNS